MKENSPTQNPMAFLMHASIWRILEICTERRYCGFSKCVHLNGPNPPEDVEPEVGETKVGQHYNEPRRPLAKFSALWSGYTRCIRSLPCCVQFHGAEIATHLILHRGCKLKK